MINTCQVFFLVFFIYFTTTTKDEQIQISIIPDSIKYNWEVNEFEVKIKNPTGIKTRIKITAQCLNAKQKIIKEVEKEYEIMLTENTTQMSIPSEKCNSIGLSATETPFFKPEEKIIYKQFYKKK